MLHSRNVSYFVFSTTFHDTLLVEFYLIAIRIIYLLFVLHAPHQSDGALLKRA